jgi:uncharacterized protein YegL
MAQMSQTTFFTSCYVSFEPTPMTDGKIQTPFESAHFGILNLHARPTTITQTEQEIVFVVDQSGSMSDICSDGREKLQHIKHTLKNMVLYFNDNPHIKAYISIHSFDGYFNSIVERTEVNEEILPEILVKINKIRPNGDTNIENALKNSGEIIDAISKANPTHTIHHIFMTDGEANSGSIDKDVLKNLVNPNGYNAFIGFGIDHDSYLLNYISGYSKSSYYFIDALEKSGLVYGEILHNILYKLFTETTIEIQNGLIYDFKNNTWVEKLEIGDFYGESNKTYHVISATPDTCHAFVEAKHHEEQIRLSIGKLCQEYAYHIKYKFRQQTLQLLFQSNKVQNKKKFINTNNLKWPPNFVNQINATDEYHIVKEEKTQIKQQLKKFFEEIKKYMLDNDLTNDNFFKNLCDDIYISYTTLGTKYGAMYTAARQTSQGTQRCYTVSQTPREPCSDDYDNLSLPPAPRHNINYSTPRMGRYTSDDDDANFMNRHAFNVHAFDLQDNLENTHHEELEHYVSDFADTPYLTPTSAGIMRDISYGPSDELDPCLEAVEESKEP